MNWSKPTTTLRSVACEHGIAYSMSPGRIHGWVLRVCYADMHTEILFKGDLEACKRAALQHLHAKIRIDSYIRTMFTTHIAMRGDEDAR